MENPELLSGIPLVILGGVGLFIALMALFAPGERAAERGPAQTRVAGHPSPAEYVQIGVALALVTAVEVALYYIDMTNKVLIPALLALSAVKFSLVVLWFMHLKFDSRIFSTFFTGGFLLALAVFIVVLATLGASLA